MKSVKDPACVILFSANLVNLYGTGKVGNQKAEFEKGEGERGEFNEYMLEPAINFISFSPEVYL